MTVESALSDVSRSLGVPTDSFKKLIQFESEFNPLARNTITGARGLIQFLHSTAQSLGFANADDLVARFPETEAQLRGPVLQYLSKYKPFGPPFPQSLYLSVFYPAFRNYPLNAEFPDTVKRSNPGIKYVGDYVAKVEKKKFKKYSAVSFFLPVCAAVLAVFFPQLKRRWLNEKRE